MTKLHNFMDYVLIPLYVMLYSIGISAYSMEEFPFGIKTAHVSVGREGICYVN
jgi:hypothetical protein